MAVALTESGLPMEPDDVQREFTGMMEKPMLAELQWRGIADTDAFSAR
ncbi:hypothetical protein [Breoghania sp.]|nr:hypothetical protein [Breoghania sp.]MDJ0932984.1 hypothetical protein [Breoghania sp.]